MDSRIENLETKSAYQEHLIQELNEVVIVQQNQIDRLEKMVQQLQGHLRASEVGQGLLGHEAKPPHY